MLNIRTVAVIGSGTMGAGIAEVAASHGHQVMMYDIASDAISRAIDGIRQRLASRVTRGKLTEEACGQILARLTPVTDISALTAADLVIEAASERLEVKKSAVCRTGGDLPAADPAYQQHIFYLDHGDCGGYPSSRASGRPAFL